MNEADESRRLTSQLRRCNALVLALTPGDRQQATGWPDRYVAHAYWSGWLELKGPRTRTRPLQARRLRDLRARGVHAWVLRFVGDGKEVPATVLVEDEDGTEHARVAAPRDGPGAATMLRALAELDVAHGGPCKKL